MSPRTPLRGRTRADRALGVTAIAVRRLRARRPVALGSPAALRGGHDLDPGHRSRARLAREHLAGAGVRVSLGQDGERDHRDAHVHARPLRGSAAARRLRASARARGPGFFLHLEIDHYRATTLNVRLDGSRLVLDIPTTRFCSFALSLENGELKASTCLEASGRRAPRGPDRFARGPEHVPVQVPWRAHRRRPLRPVVNLLARATARTDTRVSQLPLRPGFARSSGMTNWRYFSTA